MSDQIQVQDDPADDGRTAAGAVTPAPPVPADDGLSAVMTEAREFGQDVIDALDNVQEWVKGSAKTMLSLGKKTLLIWLIITLYGAVATIAWFTKDPIAMAVAGLVPAVAAVAFLAWFIGKLNPFVGLLAGLILAWFMFGTMVNVTDGSKNPTDGAMNTANRVVVSALKGLFEALPSEAGYAGHSASYWYDQFQLSRSEATNLDGHDIGYWYNEYWKLREQYEDDWMPVAILCQSRDWLQGDCTYFYPDNVKWSTPQDMRHKGWTKSPGWAAVATGFAVVGLGCPENDENECWRVEQSARQIGGKNDQPSMVVRLKRLDQ